MNSKNIYRDKNAFEQTERQLKITNTFHHCCKVFNALKTVETKNNTAGNDWY